MKGFGAFIIASILLASLLFLHASKMRSFELSSYEITRNVQSFEKIGFLRNVLQKSHAKLTTSDSVWRLEVQELADYYSVDIIIDDNRAIIADNENGVRSEFYLR